jgi:hypothetical protein
MLGAIARLRPGGTLEEAQRDVTTVAERLVRTARSAPPWTTLNAKGATPAKKT